MGMSLPTFSPCGVLVLGCCLLGAAACAPPSSTASGSTDGESSHESSPTEPPASQQERPSDHVQPLVEESPCPVGIKTSEGCAVTYDIGDAGSLEGFSAVCADGSSIYNGCSSAPLAFHWHDRGASAPKTVSLELQSSVFCADPEAPVEQKQF